MNRSPAKCAPAQRGTGTAGGAESLAGDVAALLRRKPELRVVQLTDCAPELASLLGAMAPQWRRPSRARSDYVFENHGDRMTYTRARALTFSPLRRPLRLAA